MVQGRISSVNAQNVSFFYIFFIYRYLLLPKRSPTYCPEIGITSDELGPKFIISSKNVTWFLMTLSP